MPDIGDLHRLSAYRAVARSWDRPVVIACSGGVDSSALVLLAARALRATSVGPFFVVNIDHRTRPETRLEQRTVAALCAELQIPFIGDTVTDEPGSRAGSPEDVLRTLRYDAIGRVASRVGIDTVATAHTLDDQIETVLMRLMSGASALAAAGMESETSMQTAAGNLNIIRPLLRTTRTELRTVLDRAGVAAIDDPSNEDVSFRRNAIRHRLIPVLESIDPGYGRALLRTVDQAARDAMIVDDLAADLYSEIVEASGGQILIQKDRLNVLAPALSSRIIRRAILSLSPDLGRELSFERVDAVRRAATTSQTGAVIELPENIEAEIGRDVVKIVRGR